MGYLTKDLTEEALGVVRKVFTQPTQPPNQAHPLKRRGGCWILMMMMMMSLWPPRSTLQIMINPLKVGLHFIILTQSIQC
jgi:hypothetical protein